MDIGPLRGDTTCEYKIECQKCKASIWDFISSYQPDANEKCQELIEEWNRRADNG